MQRGDRVCFTYQVNDTYRAVGTVGLRTGNIVTVKWDNGMVTAERVHKLSKVN